MLIPFGVFSAAGAGGGAAAAGAYELISTTLISTNTASVTFDVSSLSSTYKHLQIRMVARGDRSANTDAMYVRFNSDTASGTNYSSHGLDGNGSAVSSFSAGGGSAPYIADIAAASGTGSVFSPAIIDLLDPFSSTKNTTIRAMFGIGTASGNIVSLRSSVWVNTATVTSIKLGPIFGSNFVSGSRFSLYGIVG